MDRAVDGGGESSLSKDTDNRSLLVAGKQFTEGASLPLAKDERPPVVAGKQRKKKRMGKKATGEESVMESEVYFRNTWETTLKQEEKEEEEEEEEEEQEEKNDGRTRAPARRWEIMAPWEQHGSVIKLARFDYRAAAGALANRRKGFLITCGFRREKSATNEGLALLQEVILATSTEGSVERHHHATEVEGRENSRHCRPRCLEGAAGSAFAPSRRGMPSPRAPTVAVSSEAADGSKIVSSTVVNRHSIASFCPPQPPLQIIGTSSSSSVAPTTDKTAVGTSSSAAAVPTDATAVGERALLQIEGERETAMAVLDVRGGGSDKNSSDSVTPEEEAVRERAGEKGKGSEGEGSAAAATGKASEGDGSAAAGAEGGSTGVCSKRPETGGFTRSSSSSGGSSANENEQAVGSKKEGVTVGQKREREKGEEEEEEEEEKKEWNMDMAFAGEPPVLRPSKSQLDDRSALFVEEEEEEKEEEEENQDRSGCRGGVSNDPLLLRFSLVKMGCMGLVMVCLPEESSLCPVAVVRRILEDARAGVRPPTRWCQRIQPVQSTCPLEVEVMASEVHKLVSTFLQKWEGRLRGAGDGDHDDDGDGDGDQPTQQQQQQQQQSVIKFAVGYKSRAGKGGDQQGGGEGLGRGECIGVVASAVQQAVAALGMNAVVDLTSPDIAVMVDVVSVARSGSCSVLCALSLLPADMIITKPKIAIRLLATPAWS